MRFEHKKKFDYIKTNLFVVLTTCYNYFRTFILELAHRTWDAIDNCSLSCFESLRSFPRHVLLRFMYAYPSASSKHDIKFPLKKFLISEILIKFNFGTYKAKKFLQNRFTCLSLLVYVCLSLTVVLQREAVVENNINPNAVPSPSSAPHSAPGTYEFHHKKQPKFSV